MPSWASSCQRSHRHSEHGSQDRIQEALAILDTVQVGAHHDNCEGIVIKRLPAFAVLGSTRSSRAAQSVSVMLCRSNASRCIFASGPAVGIVPRLAVLCSRGVGEAQVIRAAALRVHQLLIQLAGLCLVVGNLVVRIARQRCRRLTEPDPCFAAAMSSDRC